MKIKKLIIENVKRIRVVEIVPIEKGIIEIRGKNGAGKSSVLDSIQYVFCGRDSLPKQPLRRGAEVGRIECDCGEVIVYRRFTAAGSNLTLEAASGARFRSPQHMLDEVYTAVALDVGEFARMKGAQRLQTVRPMIHYEVDLDALDGKNAADYEKRTGFNRDARLVRGQASGIHYPEDLPSAPIDITALTERWQQAGDANALLERRKARRQQVASEVAGNRQNARSKRERIEQLRRETAELEAEAESLETTAAELERSLTDAEPLPEPVDTRGMSAELEAARTTNAFLEAKTRRETLEAEATALEARSQALSDAIAERKAQMAEAIANAKMPVDGMAVDDGDVTLQGIPFDQCSQAEKIKAGAMVAIAAKPKLRVLLVRDGSLLDKDSRQVLEDLAEEHDLQVFVEVTDDNATTGIIIEDGTVVGQPNPERQSQQPSLALVQV